MSERAAKIAADFAEIPFDDHEAKILAIAYLELQEANQWLRDDLTVKIETIQAIETALRQALDCKGSYNGTVSERGGEPAICAKCEADARAALGEQL